MSVTGWLHRLRERGVIRVAASYAVIAWLLLQIADVTFEPLGVPRWVMVSLIVTAVLGFPVAVGLAWFYEAGDAGVTLDTAPAGVARPVVHGLRRYADATIIGVLLMAVAVLLVRQSELGSPTATGTVIAVLPFRDLSTEADGEILALGIAESVLHQLASLAEIDVIARTSSFVFGERAQDARDIGRQLGARYLLEGSVQSERSRMRITAQLVDAESGADIWSMRFDRTRGDIFAIQDEIAVQVTQALELALDPEATERMTGQGTENLEAYVAFLQGRNMLATDNLSEVKAAIELFGRAVALDPDFAAAYVKLAQAGLMAAEFEMSADRQARFQAALHRGEALVEKALALDAEDGDAYLQRAYIKAFTNLAAAESDYRQGLKLSPNSAEGHARLAGVVYESPARREEVLELLDRARKLDPLEPRYDVLRAVFIHYVRNDVEAANAILLDVLKQHPRYTPALARLCTFRVNAMGQAATGIRYCEEALALDPLLEDTRLILIRTYAVLGDLEAAEELVAASGEEESPRSLAILLARREWLPAGEVAYRSLARGTALPMSMADHIMAVRMHARVTGDFKRAQAVLGQVSGVRWDATGAPTLPVDTSPVRDTAIALADVLVAGDEAAKGRRLLATIVGQMRHEIDDLHRPEFWYYAWHPVALALAGEREAAIDLLGRALANHGSVWVRPGDEPAYLPFHEDVRFQALLRSDEAYLERQRDELDRLRSEGLVPDRGHKRQTASAP